MSSEQTSAVAEQSSSTTPAASTPAEKKPKVDPRKAAKEARAAQRGAAAAAKALEALTLDDIGVKPFGVYPLVQSARQNAIEYTEISELNATKANQTVWIRARVFTTRAKGKAAFLLLRDRYYTLQATLFVSDDGAITKDMVKFAGGLSKESIVDVEGVVVAVDNKIEGATQQDVELAVRKIYCVSAAAPKLPLLIEDASRRENPDASEEELSIRVNQDTRLDNRVLDLRVPANLAIFKLQSAIGKYFRDFLYTKNFIEIHTPKLIGTASEGGANVFKVDYFGGNAFLAQSPQLYKQMAVEGDLLRVFEIGSVFRAERSFTHRHMTEFIGLDMEMAIKSHYYEVLDVLSEMFLYIFDHIATENAEDLRIISQQYPFEPIVYNRPALRLSFPEGIKLLREAGCEVNDFEDLSTPDEKKLGQIVKEKYGTDFFMLDKYPQSARPFYTMPCPEDPRYSNSYDLFLRGEEICSGAQRIHDPNLLVKRANELGVDLNPIEAYVDAFKYGAWPHGGAGIGLERVVFLYLGLTNIRKSSMFPRDPRRLTP